MGCSVRLDLVWRNAVVWDAESQAELDELLRPAGAGKTEQGPDSGLGIDVSNMFVRGLEFSPQDLVQSANPNPPTAKSPTNSPSTGQSPDKPAPVLRVFILCHWAQERPSPSMVCRAPPLARKICSHPMQGTEMTLVMSHGGNITPGS